MTVTTDRGAFDGRYLAALPGAHFGVDAAGKVLYWSPGAEALTGRPADQVLGKKAWAGFAGRKVDTPIEGVLASGEAVSGAALAFKPKGSREERRALVDAAPVRGEDGAVVGVVATLAFEAAPPPVEDVAPAEPPPPPEAAPDAAAARREEFLFAEIERLAMNLGMVSRGEFGLVPSSQTADEATADLAGYFEVVDEAVRLTVGAVRRQVDDLASLAAAATEGRLDARADVTAHEGEFRKVVEGVNATLDAVIGPVRASAAVVRSIAAGEIPEPLTAEYQGEFGETKESLNSLIWSLQAFLVEVQHLSEALLEGRLDERADPSGFKGEFRQLVEAFNAAAASVAGHLDALPSPVMIVGPDLAVRYMNTAGRTLIGASSDLAGTPCHSHVSTSLCKSAGCVCRRAMDSGEAVTAECELAAGGGRYEVSVTASPVYGVDGSLLGAREVILDQTAARRAMRVAKKQADYQAGEIEKMLANLGSLAEGRLDFETQVEAGDADTEELAGAFLIIKEALDETVSAIRRLVTDARTLAEAAVAGRLDVRADLDRHKGEYRDVMAGLNETLDAAVRPVKEAAEALARLADYDLRARMEGEYAGEHAAIKQSLNGTASALHDAIAAVAQAVAQVTAAADQIASASQQVAEGASEQAAALEETSSSLEEMASMTGRNAESTQEARGLAAVAQTQAESGSRAMTEMLAAMGKIKQAAQATAEIIRDINEIAFQTNLLALNAAVEAARAGDAGRGFAVVAEEVRSLAQRSKEAARRTEELIKQSVSLAENGEVISRQVNGNLSEIVGSVGKVTTVVTEIATASEEQARGIAEVNRAMAEMDRAVQSSAANSEESASAAEELAAQAQELSDLVSRFTVEGAGAREPSTAARPRTARTLPQPRRASALPPRSNGKGRPSLRPSLLGGDDDLASF